MEIPTEIASAHSIQNEMETMTLVFVGLSENATQLSWAVTQGKTILPTGIKADIKAATKTLEELSNRCSDLVATCS